MNPNFLKTTTDIPQVKFSRRWIIGVAVFFVGLICFVAGQYIKPIVIFNTEKSSSKSSKKEGDIGIKTAYYEKGFSDGEESAKKEYAEKLHKSVVSRDYFLRDNLINELRRGALEIIDCQLATKKQLQAAIAGPGYDTEIPSGRYVYLSFAPFKKSEGALALIYDDKVGYFLAYFRGRLPNKEQRNGLEVKSGRNMKILFF